MNNTIRAIIGVQQKRVKHQITLGNDINHAVGPNTHPGVTQRMRR